VGAGIIGPCQPDTYQSVPILIPTREAILKRRGGVRQPTPPGRRTRPARAGACIQGSSLMYSLPSPPLPVPYNFLTNRQREGGGKSAPRHPPLRVQRLPVPRSCSRPHRSTQMGGRGASRHSAGNVLGAYSTTLRYDHTARGSYNGVSVTVYYGVTLSCHTRY